MGKKKLPDLRVIQTGSGARCVKSQILSLKGLGLGRIGKEAVVQDNGCIRGLIRKVSHLVKVEECNG